jgi:hypothetical protein
MATTIITDAELQLTFTGKRMNSRFEYNVIFQHNFKTHNQFTFKTIWANNKVEATRFAREYGTRFIEARVVEVQRVA